jgi:prepilin-type N-terminal cleavage/methylation domain-containing protein
LWGGNKSTVTLSQTDITEVLQPSLFYPHDPFADVLIPPNPATLFNAKEGTMKMYRSVRKGFTLIEILVTVIVIGVLAAVVIPAVTQQATSGDPARLVEDFNNVSGGIERFSVDLRPKFPGDIEDLINKPTNSTTQDVTVTGAGYTAVDLAAWNGPYVNKPSADIVDASSTIDWQPTAFGASINQQIIRCNSTAGITNGCNTSSPDYVAIYAKTLTPAQFELVNRVIDGVESAGSSESYAKGKLRYDPSTSSTYYLVAPCGTGC